MPSPSATEITLHLPINRDDDGPAMSALTDLQRSFVGAMMLLGPTLTRARSAAAAIGSSFPDQTAHTMMRNPRVLAALREEAGKKLLGASLLGVDQLMRIAAEDGHKDQYKASVFLAGINGFTVEQKITVEHVNADQREIVQRIIDNARIAGQDPTPLLAQIGIKDAEFTVISSADVAEKEDWTKT